MTRRVPKRRGGALLAVLWLTAALSAIVFTLSTTVRGELERAGMAVDSARAYYLAEGSIERLLLHLSWGEAIDPREGPVVFRPGQRRMRWETPSGVVDLEITGENGKLSLLSASPQALARLFVLLGVDESRAVQIAAGIAARRQRTGQAQGAESSFSALGASFQQLEDLLTIPGMTPDIYYGWWERNAEGKMVEKGAVARHLTVIDDAFLNVNYASPAVMQAAGLPEGLIERVVQMREGQVIREVPQSEMGASGSRIILIGGGSNAYTVRATAQLKDKPIRRTVTALLRFGRNKTEPTVGVMRWY